MEITQEVRIKRGHIAMMKHPETALYAGVMMVVTPAALAVTAGMEVLTMLFTCVSQSVGRVTRQNAPVSSKVVHSFLEML